MDNRFQQTKKYFELFIFLSMMLMVQLQGMRLAVLIKRGCGGAFWLNVLLTILGWIPDMTTTKMEILSSPVSPR
ncbi:hypothetical protein DFA_04807 [Cavenderia fasciculata]|uniref:Transmembrane protein n=1 Tax=Cavenderia fasciculata TaxID=261658 RepID=F4PNZ8_CACFS|nr:uncharacterized protein DFA_04807 [Cavenderia fasciculata]EGG22677.1 hypothetical protein DFA_04807 [Cavenderia fasciculata]|eukprot:XP_004360528.1 hypothetical protein DFA_04807 [Cavenderia fasciculata]